MVVEVGRKGSRSKGKFHSFAEQGLWHRGVTKCPILYLYTTTTSLMRVDVRIVQYSTCDVVSVTAGTYLLGTVGRHVQYLEVSAFLETTLGYFTRVFSRPTTSLFFSAERCIDRLIVRLRSQQPSIGALTSKQGSTDNVRTRYEC